MNWLALMGIVSTIASFIPILLIVIFKLFRHRSFLALSIFYILPGIYNLAKHNILFLPPNISYILGFTNNLLDAPLMLLFLCFFSYSSLMTKRIRFGIYAFLAYEMIILIILGINRKATTAILGPDIIVISSLTFILFLRQVKLTIIQQKTLGKVLGKTLMIASILLSYIIYGLVYWFFYILKIPDIIHDAMLMYYIVTFISALLMTSGMLIENKRLKKLRELRNTRKELASIYGAKTTFSNNRILKPGRN